MCVMVPFYFFLFFRFLFNFALIIIIIVDIMSSLSSVMGKFMNFSSSSNKINSKFIISCSFVAVKANAKCEAATGFSESVKTAFTHLDFPLMISQCFFSAMLTTTRALNILLFISDSLVSFCPLQLNKITFVLFVNDELNNKLSITNQYLYRLYLDKKVFTSLSFMLISTGGLTYHIYQNFEAHQFLFHQ